jgi:hypothetical protein
MFTIPTQWAVIGGAALLAMLAAGAAYFVIEGQGYDRAENERRQAALAALERDRRIQNEVDGSTIDDLRPFLLRPAGSR